LIETDLSNIFQLLMKQIYQTYFNYWWDRFIKHISIIDRDRIIKHISIIDETESLEIIDETESLEIIDETKLLEIFQLLTRQNC
jgi:hypothetical protein